MPPMRYRGAKIDDPPKRLHRGTTAPDEVQTERDVEEREEEERDEEQRDEKESKKGGMEKFLHAKSRAKTRVSTPITIVFVM